MCGALYKNGEVVKYDGEPPKDDENTPQLVCAYGWVRGGEKYKKNCLEVIASKQAY